MLMKPWINQETVTIRVSSENDVVLIAVTDYGGGLDPAFADSIFRTFYHFQKRWQRFRSCHHQADCGIPSWNNPL